MLCAGPQCCPRECVKPQQSRRLLSIFAEHAPCEFRERRRSYEIVRSHQRTRRCSGGSGRRPHGQRAIAASIEFTTSFPFTVGNEIMPAGSYMVTPVDEGQQVLELKGEKTSVLFLTENIHCRLGHRLCQRGSNSASGTSRNTPARPPSRGSRRGKPRCRRSRSGAARAHKTVADLLVDVLAQAGARRLYGVSGDSRNAITESIRATGKLDRVDVRHEEAAAFAAAAEAHVADRLAVCSGSAGPASCT